MLRVATRRVIIVKSSSLAPALPKALLPFIPRPLKFALLLLLLVNARSFPIIWHLRLFRPILALRLRSFLFVTYVRLGLAATATARALRLQRGPVSGFYTRGVAGARQDFLDKLASRARLLAPFDAGVVYKTWAGPDDCDWNMHLSNSSYAKNLDFARLKYNVSYFIPWFTRGGWIALGGASYTFAREIPLGARYEMRVTIGGWDHKWVYLVARFVTRRKPVNENKDRGNTLVPYTSTPATPPVSSTVAPTDPAPAIASLEGDGYTEHARAISRYCFKHARATVPPALALAVCGFGQDDAAWAAMHGAACATFFRGGWRDIPEDEQWWRNGFAAWEERARQGAAEAWPQ